LTTPTLSDALTALREASGRDDLGEHDAEALTAAIEALGQAAPAEAVSLAGETLLQHELTQLMWPPLQGARLVDALLAHGTPTASLLQTAMVYLSMYFQELDGLIADCRARLEVDAPPAEVAATLRAAVAAL
jgi:hypothetical protein